MKRIMLALACLFASYVGVQAQDQGDHQRRTPEERAKMTVEKLSPDLALKDDQKTKLNDAYTEFYKAMEKLRADAKATGNRPDRDAFKKLGDDRDTKVKGFLTDDQFKKYNEKMEEMKKQRGGGRGHGGGNGKK
ncbi:hypothetical protein F0L74_13030 [Chitinophaga agrisoli]|uniref:DUF4890 domain-containing protein n=1 Tax=Chitinophaga agrisoli TaxID=2607653 RepID=A0A5B2VYW9_9BACT|nr:hypothetical protein [Chitinophaga agrisoli]KAA2243416.1 hypothetical protein F0L74_13030 [Chitinophaga agrisoli]